MKILVTGDVWNTPAIKHAAAVIGAEPVFLSSRHPDRSLLRETFAAVLAGSDHGDHTPLSDTLLPSGSLPVIPLGAVNMAAGIGTVSREETAQINPCFAYGGPANLRSGFLRVGRLLGLEPGEMPAEPVPVPFDAIFAPGGKLYPDLEAYFAAEGRKFDCYAGMLSYRGRWVDEDLDVEQAIIDSLARRGIGVIPAFTDGSENRELGTLSFREAVSRFFCREGRPVIDLLINFQFFGVRGDEEEDMFTRAAALFTELDIPVVRPVGLSRMNREEWEASERPYAGELPTNFVIPELQGMTEPVHVSCADASHDRVPIPERIERFTGRLARYFVLRRKANADKRVVLFLHNAPCSGVEATVGMATDLDAFQSAVDIMRRLQAEGYGIENIPEDGEALRRLIFEKKAYSDFRWTPAEDILAAGGVFYSMPEEEYLSFYSRLTENARRKMEDSWGAPPGEAMTVDGKILLPGISFSHLLLMVQPKRGCYGAKCTGEVCKILQDPACPPSHQYLAAYWYLQEHWKADALIHLGTHGSLEYLPGKACGLSRDCFPDMAAGELPDFYPYNAAVLAQALIARRRAYAVTISYLPAPGKGLSEQQRHLYELLTRYSAAAEQASGQTELIRQEIEAMAGDSPAVKAVLDREPDFDAAVQELRALLNKTEGSRKTASHRAFGAKPDRQWILDYITELWMNEADTREYWSSIEDPGARSRAMCRLIEAALDQTENDNTENDETKDPAAAALAEDARILAAALEASDMELEALVHGLEGGYLSPSPAGDSAGSGRMILPTGRNLHGGEDDKIPTPAAYVRGTKAAEDLLSLYRQDSGALPEKVAMNMTSIDVTRTGGEQLSQFLALMGVRPVWNASGRVEDLECIPLEELGRPRIDVTAHISSVMRDASPVSVVLMDRAVRLAAAQDEPEDRNYVRRNSRLIAEQGEVGTGRVFGAQPGTYTSSVGLALKASAWKDENDLAKYFIDSSSYLYGEERHGERAAGTFAANIRQVDLTSDITASRKTDAIASSYSARIQGSYQLAARALGSRKRIRHYMGESSSAQAIRVVSMDEHIAKAIDETLLNDFWREEAMSRGYAGGSEIMERMQNIFDTQCMLENIPDHTLDVLTETYLLSEEMQQWFAKNNAYALEESGRRFLELHSRGKWNGDPQILRRLQREYLKAEGDMEDGVSGQGEIQGGNVDIVTHDQVEDWAGRLQETEALIRRWNKKEQP